MRFLLESGEVVFLCDEKADLSTLFTQILQDSNVFTTLDETLKYSTHFKKNRKEFVDLLKRVMAEGDTNEERVRQLANPESELSVAMRRAIGEHNQELQGCLEYVHTNIDYLLAPIRHRLAFVKDNTMRLVIEYLNIQSPLRSTTMFDSLPFAYQGRTKDTDLRTLVDPKLVPYIDFIEQLSDDCLMELSKMALQLGIDSLSVLIGCRLAKMIDALSEDCVRKRFRIPDDKYINSTNEKLESILREQPWMKFTIK